MKNKLNIMDRSGIVNCLGWCNKQFRSPDKFTIRFCSKCSERKESEVKKNGNSSKSVALDSYHDD